MRIEKAIETLKGLLELNGIGYTWFEGELATQAVDMAINALELQKRIDDGLLIPKEFHDKTYALLQQRYFDLLGKTQWIPVSERLPNVEDADCMGFVICAWQDGSVETFSIDQIEEWQERHPENKIIAWMPTPIFSKEMLG